MITYKTTQNQNKSYAMNSLMRLKVRLAAALNLSIFKVK